MIVSFDNIGFQYSSEWIFKNLSGKFQSPEKIILTGANGAGKSTFLHLLWGQRLPTEGTMEYVLNNEKILPQEIYQYISLAAPYMELPEELTLLEIIRFHFQFKKQKEETAPNELMAQWHLADHAHKRLSDFSSGMKQRVKLGLAFHTQAAILFLDEPCTNLDQDGVVWYKKLLAASTHQLVFIASNRDDERPSTYREFQLKK